MLEKMTESLFAETLKRIAENVWKTKLENLAANAGGSYGPSQKMSDLFTDVFIECLKKDPVLRAKVEQSICDAAHKYFDGKLGKS